ncbi:MAG TPA: CHAT domain-containing tetratricopeptide repeat protein [Bacteroidales bacterium]|nr:CHAT domain-containing tetratricopeptide repeat protein [Bacteroidales bacterium]
MKKELILSVFTLCCLAECFSQPWARYEALWNKSLVEGKLDSALYYANETWAIMRGKVGENSLQYASLMHNLADLHFNLGSYRKARYFIKKEMDILESLNRRDDQEYIDCLETASVISRKAGYFEDALAQIKNAEKKVLESHSNDDPSYAEVLYYYSAIYHDIGCTRNDVSYLSKELDYLKSAEIIYQKNKDLTENYLINQCDQASCCYNLGNIPLAETKLKEAVEKSKKIFGQGSTAYAAMLNNLSVVYYNLGNYKLCEKFLLEALNIYKKTGAKTNKSAAICYSNLGALYSDIGNYSVALEFIGKAKKLFEDESQFENPAYALILNNIASVSILEEYYALSGDKNNNRLADTGKMLSEADSIFSISCLKSNYAEQIINKNLTSWYGMTGNKDRILQTISDYVIDGQLTDKVIVWINKMSFSNKLPHDNPGRNGPEPLLISVDIQLLGDAARMSSGDNPMPILTKWTFGEGDNLKKALGPYHPAYINMLRFLIGLYNGAENFKSEEELMLGYLNAINHNTQQDFTFLAESEKELYYQMRLRDISSFTAYSLRRKTSNPSITGYTYDNILINKGLMLKSSTAMRFSILNSNNPVLLKKYDDWIALQKEISALYSTPVSMRSKNVKDLEHKADSLEKSLSESSRDYSDFRRGLQVKWEDVKRNLKPDEAAIEFTDFRRKEVNGGNKVIYAALVLKSNSDYPEMIKLFDEEQLNMIINTAFANDISKINNIYGTAVKQDSRLYNLIWKPVEPFLIGVKKVYISPSGLLNKISFPALSKDKDVYLCDEYEIQVKGSTGSIVNRDNHPGNGKPTALVFGGIEYSPVKSETDVWPYLTGTKIEGDTIKHILEEGKVYVQYLTGTNATETYFKQNAPNYSILHLATHGFFFSDPSEIRFVGKKENIEYGAISFRGTNATYGVARFVNNDNPLMRSGLVLADANDVWVKPSMEKTDDGVLTAQEVTQLDLRKIDLVVLSACESGLGDIKKDDEVYGLQRSFKMAGAKCILMSLWQIPDKETVEFMSRFYSHLLISKDITSSFYMTQKEMRKIYDPYYWGAFVLLD